VRTRIEREFDPDVVRRLKGGARHNITVNGPALAAQALRAGLVDEIQMFICPRSSAPENGSPRIVCC
jgi:riboflavin biosynthesis pyrimidine reductase